MKKMTKRIMAAMLAGIMALSLTVCSSGKSSTAEIKENGGEKKEASADTASGSTVEPKNGDTYSIGFASY